MPADDARFASHHALVAQLLGTAPAGTAGGLDAIVDQLAASSAPVSCLSSEDVSLLYDRPELLARLRDAVISTGYQPQIVVYVRPQVSYAIAIYAANVLSGYRLPFTTFLRDVFEYGCYKWDGGSGPPFDYAILLDAFARTFGTGALHVRVFRSDARDSALLQSFVGTLLPALRDLRAFVIPAKRANRTLTFSSVLNLLGVENTIDQHVRFAPLTLTELARFVARFSGSNRLLRRRYGVPLPALEPADIMRALPLRRTPAMIAQLRLARRLFAGAAREGDARSADGRR